MIQYIRLEDVIAINEQHGGGAGVRDIAIIESALGRPQQGYAGFEAFPTLWAKAAALLHGLISTQGFVDGNKRTGWVAALVFLEANGEPFDPVDTDEAEAFLMRLAESNATVEECAEWLYSHARPLVAELDAVGQCRLCGVHGPLPGAEMWPRETLRRIGTFPSGGAIQEWQTSAGVHDMAVMPFRLDRDLVPGICATCRDGWLRLIDREGLPPAVNLLGLQPASMGVAERKKFAAWAVKASILRSILEPGIAPEWSVERAERLRRVMRLPAGWSIWLVTVADPQLDLGRFSYAALSDPRIPPPQDNWPTVAQHTFVNGHLGVVTCFDHPDLGFPLSATLMNGIADDGLALRLWPSEERLNWPCLPLDRHDLVHVGALLRVALGSLESDADH